jgi:hypothetical protein
MIADVPSGVYGKKTVNKPVKRV